MTRITFGVWRSSHGKEATIPQDSGIGRTEACARQGEGHGRPESHGIDCSGAV